MSKFLKFFSSRAVSLLCIVAAGLFIYSNSFRVPFQYDDFLFIVDNPAIRDLARPLVIWDYLPTRVVDFFSLALNYHFGKLNVVGYHAFNLAVHLGAACMVYWLTLLTFVTPVMKKDRLSGFAASFALCAGILFVAHPLHTESVTYIHQRSTSLAGLWYLFSLCLYVKSRVLGIGAGVSFKRNFCYIASFCAAIIAMLTKENTITLPLIIILYEFSFLKDEKPVQWKHAAPFLIILAVIPLMMLVTKPITFSHVDRLAQYPKLGWYYFLTQLHAKATYLRLLVLPYGQNFDYDYPLARSILELPVLGSMALIATLCAASVAAWKRYRLISFGILWFFITLLPESSFFPQPDFLCEHRLYVPSVGYCVVLTGSLFYVFLKKNLKLAITIILIVVGCYGALTYRRNIVWQRELSLLNDTLRKSPGKARPYYGRGFYYLEHGKPDKALIDFNKSLEINPGFSEAYAARGRLLLENKQYAAATDDCNRALAINPSYVRAYVGRADVHAALARYAQAISDYTKAIEIQIEHMHTAEEDVYNSRGLVYAATGRYDDAMADFTKAIGSNSSFAQAYNNRGLMNFKKGNFDEALADYARAIARDPFFIAAYYNRGRAYESKGDLDQALAGFDYVINKNPDFAQAYMRRAIIRASQQKYELAWQDVHKAEFLGLKASPDFIRTLQ